MEGLCTFLVSRYLGLFLFDINGILGKQYTILQYFISLSVTGKLTNEFPVFRYIWLTFWRRQRTYRQFKQMKYSVKGNPREQTITLNKCSLNDMDSTIWSLPLTRRCTSLLWVRRPSWWLWASHNSLWCHQLLIKVFWFTFIIKTLTSIGWSRELSSKLR